MVYLKRASLHRKGGASVQFYGSSVSKGPASHPTFNLARLLSYKTSVFTGKGGKKSIIMYVRPASLVVHQKRAMLA